VVVDDDLCISDCSIFWDASDFIMCEVEDHVGANCDTFFALCKEMQLLWQGRDPQVFQGWVIHEFRVLGGGLLCDWMNGAIADLFDIDIMLESACGGSEVLGDCVPWRIVECQVDYMIEGMHGNTGGSSG